MDDDNSQDTYVAQLREVFESCDLTGTGYLGHDEVTSLCQKLQLTDQVSIFIKHLFGSNPTARVDFQEFKEGFISLLTQSADIKDEEEECEDDTAYQFSDREVSPKLVLGNKKYGRRSRPESLADTENGLQVDFSDSEVLFVPDASHEAPDMVWTSSPKVDSCDVQHDSKRNRRFIHRGHSEPTPKSSIDYSPVQSFISTPECRQGNTTDLNRLSQRTKFFEMDTTFGSQVRNAEEFLRSIWKKLEVGNDGYLNLEELTRVCEHIGMEMSDDVVAQLFDKLDCDQDGQISFEELLQGLFQHGGPNASNISSYTCDTPVEGSPIRKPIIFNIESADDRQMAPVVSESGVFTSIDPDNSGYADASSLVDLWESLGLTGGMRFLKELGYNPNLKINLQDLTVLLEEELTAACQSSGFQFALTTYQSELRHLKTNYEQVKAERDKLRVNLAEANTRAVLLAQEVDDHHAKLEKASQNKLMHIEKKYQEQLRELQEELQKDRESLTAQTSHLKQQLQEELELARDEENKLRGRLSALQNENSRLEFEVQETSEKFSEAKKLNDAQQKEVETVAELREKIAELESGQDLLQDQQYQSLLQEWEQFKKQNKELQDHNDELSLELESLRQQIATTSRPQGKRHKRIGSWLSDYNNKGGASGSRLKRRGSGSSTDENSGDDSPKLGKVRRRIHLTPEVEEGLSRMPFEVEQMKENHQEEMEKLKNDYERTLREVENSYRNRITDLEAQLLKQADVDKDNMDFSLDGSVQMDTLVQRLQEELDEQRNTVKTLKIQMQQQVEEVKRQITEEIRIKEETLSRKEDEIGNIRAQLTSLLSQKDEELNRQIKMNKQLESQKHDLEKKMDEVTLSCLEKEQTATSRESSKNSLSGHEIVKNFSNNPNTVSTDLNSIIDSLRTQLKTDIQKLFNIPSSNPCQAAGGDESLMNRFNDKLDSLLSKTLKTLESQLETNYFQEQENIKQEYEEKLKHLRQEHMMERVEMELQYKEELHKLRHFQSQGTEETIPSQTDMLLKDLYVENAALTRELQKCEEQLLKAEQNSTRLQYKCKVLSKLLADITRSAVL
ncbi:ninein-like protein isoform X2 [Limulus polyphemus]|nr:ninein-like protein isoform X2 [Limulus polyphemus]XP_022247192.1 ninein-like protein isoform X2 [Limulus polyphemus]XP_022247193.1 ninein-like protein isoform X2 [Limulus polyphemus]XP_022247194.1 ninein-like protein isoform X2 [Limulus polyphemus]XP_022247195.1 ninein-like protein isoform X2 [Limulus polyphemus]XP_022247196.1 ninein-like protein isoform X2 [Limulus polyphemus]XP_022247197.1 ninein-like protein isoform X2 [Limulus polyphemus]